jgi:hypothetical protein
MTARVAPSKSPRAMAATTEGGVLGVLTMRQALQSVVGLGLRRGALARC